MQPKLCMHPVEYFARKKALSFALLLFLLVDPASAVNWIGIYKEGSILSNSTGICKLYNLTRQQAKLCKRGTDTMPYVYEAARLSVYTCQNLFRFRRWNCSSIRLLPTLLPDLAGGTKERAFVNAISSAALTYAVARGCSASTIHGCGCSPHPDDPPNGNFKWGGCGDNVLWGSKFSRQFGDVRLKSTSTEKPTKRLVSYKIYKPKNKHRALARKSDKHSYDEEDNNVMVYNQGLWHHIKLHNGEVGRRIVSNSLITHCKCHGVSGSCSAKTCWKGLPLKFHQVGESLMTAYNSAVQVHPLTTSEQLINRFNGVSSLVYASTASSYCDYDPKTGSFGTSGRECNDSANTQDNCDNMCCNRGYKSCIVEQTEKCNCKYHWCCYVTCDTCHTKRKVNICN